MTFEDKRISLSVLSAGLRIFILLLASLSAFAKDFVDKRLEWQSTIPTFQELGLEPETLTSIVTNKIVTLTYPEKDLKTVSINGDKQTIQARVVSAMSVIDAPSNKVKNLVNDRYLHSIVVSHLGGDVAAAAGTGQIDTGQHVGGGKPIPNPFVTTAHGIHMVQSRTEGTGTGTRYGAQFHTHILSDDPYPYRP